MYNFPSMVSKETSSSMVHGLIFLCDAQTRHEDSAEVARVHHVAGQFG